MTFTKEQMEVLSQWEEHFKTAINAHWSRGIGTRNYATLHKIMEEATHKKRSFHPSCGNCMFNLIKDAGVLYFADKQEMMDLQNDAVAVELTEQEVKTEKAVVKTRKPRKKKEDAV